MVTTIKGLQGTIGDTDMATQLLLLPPHVYSSTDLAISQVGTTRQVAVAAGTAWANFVKVGFDATTLTCTPPATGGEWWAIVATRQWSPTNTAVLEAIDTGVSTDGTIPKFIPKALYTSILGSAWWRKTPGTSGSAPNGAHQILGFVHVRAADTTLTIFDCRLIRGAGALAVPNLNALAAQAALGFLSNAALVTVGLYASLYGQFHERSVWMVRSDGAVMPANRIVFGGRNAGADALEELRALSAAGLLNLQTGESVASNSYVVGDGYRWNGNAWIVDQPAQLASPAFTGTPTAPMAAPGDNSSILASTSWVARNATIRVSSLQQLWNLMGATDGTKPPYGSLIAVLAATDLASVVHYASLWRVTGDGKAEPVNGVPILIDNQSSLGQLEYFYASNGGNARFNFDHGNTSVVCVNGGNVGGNVSLRVEYRWDALGYGGRIGFKLWPGQSACAWRLNYQGGTDQSLGWNQYTTLTYDTWDFNPLGCTYNSDGSVVLPARTEGRWETRFKASLTNDEMNVGIRLTTYNVSRAIDEMTGYNGAYADRPMVNVGEMFCTSTNTIRTALERTNSQMNQWRRRGNNGTGTMPNWSMKFIAWA